MREAAAGEFSSSAMSAATSSASLIARSVKRFPFAFRLVRAYFLRSSSPRIMCTPFRWVKTRVVLSMIPLFASTCLVQFVGVTMDSFSRFSMAVRPHFSDFTFVETSPARCDYPRPLSAAQLPILLAFRNINIEGGPDSCRRPQMWVGHLTFWLILRRRVLLLTAIGAQLLILRFQPPATPSSPYRKQESPWGADVSLARHLTHQSSIHTSGSFALPSAVSNRGTGPYKDVIVSPNSHVVADCSSWITTFNGATDRIVSRVLDQRGNRERGPRCDRKNF
jgi:hypothetical protein